MILFFIRKESLTINYKEDENTIVYEVKESGLTVKDALTKKLDLSGRLSRRIIKNNLIKSKNRNKRVKSKTKLKKGDVLIIKMEEEKFVNTPQSIDLDIIYEDYDVLIINKEPNIVVHPTKTHKDFTVANGIAYYFKQKSINKKVRFVNRLDMNTSGILIIAKNPFGHQQMAKQFEENLTDKKYLGVVKGAIKKDRGVINKAIGKDKENSIKNVVTECGKKSITKYRVVERLNDATIVEFKIETGRTHQIRVHFSHIGHPIIGDTLYYKDSQYIKRQALHSSYLSFRCPRTNERIEVTAEIPNDMKELIKNIRHKART